MVKVKRADLIRKAKAERAAAGGAGGAADAPADAPAPAPAPADDAKGRVRRRA